MERWRLRTRRKALGYSQTSLALAIGCDRNTVNRWERGANDVAAHHREPLRKALSTETDTLTLVDLEALLNGDPEPQLVPGWGSLLVTLEQTATSLRIWEPSIMPGLLQTRDYASAILRDDELVATRLDRQNALTRERQPLELTAVIDESVLLRPIGGPDVLTSQLDHLVKMTKLPNVDIRVFPFDALEQPLYFGELAIYGFPWSPNGLAYQENATGPVLIVGPGQPEAHATRFQRLIELSVSDSIDRIKREITRYDR